MTDPLLSADREREDAVYDALRVTDWTGDMDRMAATFWKALTAQGFTVVALPAPETPPAAEDEPKTTRWHIEAAIERLNDSIESYRMTGEEPNVFTDVVSLLEDALAGKPEGWTAYGYSPPSYGTIFEVESAAVPQKDGLRALSDAATPGPWAGCAHVAGTDTDCPCRYRGDVVSTATDEVLLQMRVGPDEHPGAPDDDSWKGVKTTDLEQGYVDGRFIVAAVNYVRAALGEKP